MTHLIRDQKKLLNRVRRIRGQIDSIQEAIEGGQDYAAILHNIAGLKGALEGLMAEVIESHIRDHVADPKESPASARSRATEGLIDVLKAYLR